MLPLLLAGLGLAAGGAKSAIDSGKEARARKLAAETTRYSPWTGKMGEAPPETDWFGNMLQGGMAGGMLGMNVNSVMGKGGLPADPGMGPVADGDTYGGYLASQQAGGGGVGPVANGNMYSAMLQKNSPWFRS